MTATALVHVAADNGMPVAVRVPPGVAEWGDRKLDNWINRTASAAGTHRAAFEQHAILTGYGLMVRRERCGPRKFKPWLHEHFDGHWTTAYSYIKAAETVGLSVAPTLPIEPPEAPDGVDAEIVDAELVDDVDPRDYDRALAGLDAALAYAQAVHGCAFPVALIERAHRLMQIIQRADDGPEGS
jgi:hypothetical protein